MRCSRRVMTMLAVVALAAASCGDDGAAGPTGSPEEGGGDDAAEAPLTAAEACGALAAELTAAAVTAEPQRSAAGVVRETRDVLEDTPGAEVVAVALEGLREALVDLGGASPEPTAGAYAWALVPVIEIEAAAGDLADCATGIRAVAAVLPPGDPGLDPVALCRAWLVDGEVEVADDFFTRDSTGPISLTFGVAAVQGWLGDIEAARAADPTVGEGVRDELAELLRAGIRWDQTAAGRLDGDLAAVEAEVDRQRKAAGVALDAAGAGCLDG